MRIGMCHVDLPPHSRGGVARQVDLLAETLSARGHDVHVWSTTRGPQGSSYIVHALEPLAGRGARVYGVALRFRRVPADDLDVLHTHGDDWLMPGATPRVRTFYGSALQEARSATSWKRRGAQSFAYATEWLAAARADATVSISRITHRQLPLVRRVVPCMVDEAYFSVKRPQADAAPRALFVAGTLGGRKRGALVVEAVRALQDKHPGLRLTIVCPEQVDLPFVDMRPGVSTTELAELYARSDVLLSGSSYEGFGVPYAEALAAGTPVLTTDNAGAREVLEDGRLGIVCDAEQLTPKLDRLLSDGVERRRLSDQGRAAATRYHPHVVAATYEELYDSVIRKQQ